MPKVVVLPVRNIAVDAYRGFVMLLMMAEVLHLSHVSQALPGNWFWSVLAWNQTHVAWAGCSLHDLIQPSFSFLVGVALPWSIASRRAKGATFGDMFRHTLWRAFLLTALGVGLRAMSRSQTNLTFEDTLSQIGLGYTFLFLLGFRSGRVQWIAFWAIVVAYWAAWALYPVSGDFGAHWAKNANLGSAFDFWLLNALPHTKPFTENSGGYLTLSFIPTLGTMILGLIAGRWIREADPEVPMARFAIYGAAGLALGAILHFTGVCPVVKRIWTPSWTIFSGGACFLLLAAFSWVTEVRGWRRWAFPLRVIGTNSIAAYMIVHLFERFILRFLRFVPGENFFRMFGEAYASLVLGSIVLAIYWGVLWAMHKRRLFLRI